MTRLNNILKTILDIDFFKLVFLAGCFFYCIPFTNPIMTVIFKGFIAWGCITFLVNFFVNKKFSLKKADYLLFVFLLIGAIGTIVNFKHNLVTNIISVAYLFIQTILMLSFNEENLDSKLCKLKKFARIVVYATFVCSVLSILIFVLNFKYSYADGFQQIIFGVFENRLWGIQGNPNSLAQFALVSIWSTIVLLFINQRNSGKKSERVFLYINIVIEAICCVLSNSRSTTLGIFASFICFVLFTAALHKKKSEHSIWQAILKNKLFVLFSILAVIAGSFAFQFTVQKIMPLCAKPFASLDMNFLDTPENDGNPQPNENDQHNTAPSTDQHNTDPSTDREYDDVEFSNGRFELWQAAFKVVLEKPVFGVGVKNINDNLNRYLSEATVQATPKLSENTHNIYIQVLVAHGIPAFLIFIIFLVIFLFKTLKYLFTFNAADKENRFIFKMILTYFSMVCSLLVVNLFDSNILYFCSVFLVPVFWASISNINYLLGCSANQDNKKSVLFMVDSLETGGTEKALIDLTNKLDLTKYKLSVKAVYNTGKYRNDLNDEIDYSYIVKKPTKWRMRIFYRCVKFLPAKLLYQLTVTEKYDVEIAFHELLSTKILSGSSSNASKLAWIHTNIFAAPNNFQMFLGYKSFVKGYNKFDKIICVSNNLTRTFNRMTNLHQKTLTVYNPINAREILSLSEAKCDITKVQNTFVIVSVGRLEKVKGYDKLLSAFLKLKQTCNNAELWILGEGTQRENLETFIAENGLKDSVKLLGFQENPYNYLKQADLFISTSLVEGFSLAVAEAIVLGLPIISTATDGPKELLEDGKYGMLIDADEASVFNALKTAVTDTAYLNELRRKSAERKEFFENMNAAENFDKLIKSLHFTLPKEHQKPFCTVCTATYNRAYILDHLYESLKRQTDKDFEWVVIDDGSSDHTEELFKDWISKDNGFKITYVKVENNGKQKAVNKGLDLASGEMFFIVDSDDYLSDDAIEKIKYYANSIRGKSGFAGVSGMRSYTNDSRATFPETNNFVDCTNMERSKNYLSGDKAEVYYTELFKNYKFPEIDGEKFITECVVWDKIAFDGYKMRWFHHNVVLGNYLEDGLTKCGSTLYDKNPIGFLLYIRNESTYYPFDIKRKIGNYYRYYMITKDTKSFKQIADDLLISKAFLKLIVVMNRAFKGRGK